MGIYEWMRADTERSARALRTKEVCREEVDEELAPKRHKPSRNLSSINGIQVRQPISSPPEFLNENRTSGDLNENRTSGDRSEGPESGTHGRRRH